MSVTESEVYFMSEIKKNVINVKWWKAAAVRAIKTMAQSAIGAIGAAALISDVNWIVVLSTAGLSGVISLLTSIAGLPEVEE